MMVFYFILWHFNHCCLKNHVFLYINGEQRIYFIKRCHYHFERSHNMPSPNITIDPSRYYLIIIGNVKLLSLVKQMYIKSKYVSKCNLGYNLVLKLTHNIRSNLE